MGSLPEDQATYDARAATNNVDGLSCPVLFLHGEEDKIVPPNQAELMHSALLKKGLPTALKMYTGEQHGFRKSEARHRRSNAGLLACALPPPMSAAECSRVPCRR